MKTIYLKWYGPFTSERVATLSANADIELQKISKNGIYAITGMEKNQKYTRLQYIGITERAFNSRFYNHHKIDRITRNKQIWLCVVNNTKRVKRETLELAEWMLIHFNDSELELCERKKVNPPRINCSVVSEFINPKTHKSYKKLPSSMRDIPEVMIWNHETSNLRYCTKLKNFALTK